MPQRSASRSFANRPTVTPHHKTDGLHTGSRNVPKPNTSPNYLKQAGAVAGGVVAGNLISAALLQPRIIVMRDDEGNPVDPCAKEVKNFLDCAKNSVDLSYCEGLKQALVACREKHEGKLPPGVL